MTADAALARFVAETTLDDCPDAAVRAVTAAALDALGLMLAGAGDPTARGARVAIRAEGGLPLCTVLGSTLRTAPTWAALANGIAADAGAADAGTVAPLGHAGRSLLAAALACAEAAMSGGRAVVLGVVVGFEAAPAGATVGCAATASRILELDADRTWHALGLAAGLASARTESPGDAARNGVWSALAAREGVRAANGGGPAACSRLERRWQVLELDRDAGSAARRAAFVSRVSGLLARDDAEIVADEILNLDGVPDIRALTSRLAGDLD